MNNAERFKEVFDLYATEVWSMPEKLFLEWLNSEARHRPTVVYITENGIKVDERKTGRWYDVGALSCRCSECGCKSPKEYSFCPNCGADMRGENDGHEH